MVHKGRPVAGVINEVFAKDEAAVWGVTLGDDEDGFKVGRTVRPSVRACVHLSVRASLRSVRALAGWDGRAAVSSTPDLTTHDPSISKPLQPILPSSFLPSVRPCLHTHPNP